MAQESFYTSSSWTCPVGVSSITVECWGAGGSGAGGANAAGAGGGGGADGPTTTTTTYGPTTLVK